jgi:type I restriction enzyme S subunit
MKYPAYQKYKDSGIDWLSAVPDHWKLKAIKWESLVQRGASPRPIDDPIYFDDEGEYAWVRISDVTAAGMYLEVTEQKLSELGSSLSVKLRPGSLFLSIAGTVGKPCITKIKCCIHDGFVYFPRWVGEPRFLFYIFASGEPYKGLGKMGTQLNLNTDTVGGIVLGLPTSDEQTAIADFLDRETGRIDTLVAKKRKLVELLKEKRSALISRTVTRGLPANVAREFGLKPHKSFKQSGVEWLGEVPEGWGALPLRRLIKYVKTGGTPTGAEEHHFENEGFNWYSPSDFSEAVYLGASTRALSEEGKTEVRIFPPMTVMLVGIGATIGKAGLAKLESSCNQQINGIVCDINLDPVFATYYLKTMRDFIVKCGKYTTMPIINQDETKNLIFTVPPNTEQTAIATYLERETAKIDRLIEKVEAAIACLLEYRTALITAAVTGKIDVREYTI